MGKNHPLLFITLLVVCIHSGAPEKAAPDAKVTTQADLPPPLSPGLRRDRSALLALRSRIYDFGTSRIRAGWSTSRNSNPCFPEWPFVTCAAGRVLAVQMASVDIRVSQLPNSLANMDRLLVLDLSGNEIYGTLPSYWGRRLSFPRLQELNLEENNLGGTLPTWNTRRTWRNLRRLLLGGNNFVGSLPTTWAGPNTPMKRLVTLDLSDNYLGAGAAGATEGTISLPEGSTDWGNGDARTFAFPGLKTLNLADNLFTGTLPAWGKAGAYPNLQTLDLGSNQLTGALRNDWGNTVGAFPRLQTLVLAGNSLGDPAAPGGLPATWTSRFVPRSFPRLQDMVLYPGNDYVCAWLDGNVQGDATYAVKDDMGEVYSAAADNVMMCPDPSVDNPPTSVTLSQPGGAGQPLALSWQAPGADPGFACGYRVSLSKDSAVVSGFPKDYQVRPSQDAALTGGPSFTVASLLANPSPGTYTASVSTLFCNTFTSTAAASTGSVIVS